ncbi:pyridoxine [Geopyxis carbonaria]|nr:pyridoxine [Geopyxis carbonaria]
MTDTKIPITIGVLALQGAFSEHLQLLHLAAPTLPEHRYTLTFRLVKTPPELALCSALIIPGGESTTMALIAARSSLLEPLRDFVKVARRPTWGTCAGMILLSESANRTKVGGQDLIGGLDVRVNRNHFGRQVESFVTPLQLSCLGAGAAPFSGVFIRAPIVEAVLPKTHAREEETVHAPSKNVAGAVEARIMEGQWERVEVLAELPAKEVEPRTDEGLNRADRRLSETDSTGHVSAETMADREREREKKSGNARVVAVRQGNCFGTSFHPELTGDTRLHRWWLEQVIQDLERREELAKIVEVEVR